MQINTTLLVPPGESDHDVELEKGPNIKPLPLFGELSDLIEGPVLLKMGNDVSTDEIMPAGAAVLPFRSNIPEISRFAFNRLDPSFYERAMACRDGGSFVVGGSNYGQGSSREHAALAPRYLGLKAVLAKGFARIHAQNLINFGIVPLVFADPGDWEGIRQDDVLRLEGLRGSLRAAGRQLKVYNLTQGSVYGLLHNLNQRQLEILMAGGLINSIRSHT